MKIPEGLQVHENSIMMAVICEVLLEGVKSSTMMSVLKRHETEYYKYYLHFCPHVKSVLSDFAAREQI